ncbi:MULTISPECIES: Hsp20/alpha crystallin family protein [Nocardiopsis]|jgi:HSP20 family protein|uniref:Heat shock protein Hsp20 n=1 Tax=Nocardiopsis dassonvillei (strain ATCC 23218 / DSM 43111 / CIP 107115 / JCM 7437 / KCTC 9190 / NBRC 14626 / NCTC 10488 / NRRL B-5397 / IMRU 509) TaxID=446468 RepID=D7B7W2_NOCDD|nr:MULTISPECIES: Hsp20/alpha crystallin family protein [Nocardiopsis]ADH70270.1 heat shock protein Hsp20 [Nocardiopsis dassonvillei subsp. dassonvillei DSM 43111]APC33565.1 heat-shock protein Hsp20 [Nocardiopsis dassonvillei]NKY80080.1 Hsp20/alpha crystallin family protein [Nocardiopsis dassonvillei]VEI91177.1 HSP 18 [Nocardiopsis dassonvillei]
MMLMRTDPFRDIDRLTQRILGDASRPAAMPIDAYRDGDVFVVCFDLPGVRADSIDLEVERNVLTVTAERPDTVRDRESVVVAERPTGTFSRQLFLGETLETDAIQADYADGVLTLRIPVAEQAKPRKISVGTGEGQPRSIRA